MTHIVKEVSIVDLDSELFALAEPEPDPERFPDPLTILFLLWLE
jgi:hypothetical protein